MRVKFRNRHGTLTESETFERCLTLDTRPCVVIKSNYTRLLLSQNCARACACSSYVIHLVATYKRKKCVFFCKKKLIGGNSTGPGQ
jgi:hypothetical protein